MICPQAGITGEQFRELMIQFDGTRFTDEEVRYVMSALSATGFKSGQRDPTVTYPEFKSWIDQNHMTIL